MAVILTSCVSSSQWHFPRKNIFSFIPACIRQGSSWESDSSLCPWEVPVLVLCSQHPSLEPKESIPHPHILPFSTNFFMILLSSSRSIYFGRLFSGISTKTLLSLSSSAFWKQIITRSNSTATMYVQSHPYVTWVL